MAPAAQAPVKSADYDGSRPRFPSLEAWLSVYGNTEYAIYKRDAALNPMTYEEWSQSEHVLGPFLWRTTLDVWGEDSSSEEDLEVQTPQFTARAPTRKQSKKSFIPNGHGQHDPAKSTAAVAQPEDAAAAAKRKRKPKKPYLSEDIVVSDFSDEANAQHLVVEAAPSVVNVPANPPANGRRKSGGRKKKQYLSAETVSPEDEDDYSQALDEYDAASASPHKPSVPELHRPVAATTPEEPRGKRGKKLKKKSLSQAVISRDDDEQVGAIADAATTPKNVAASPEGPGSSSRRGLRTRTPAQQRPYFHNAQVFDDLVSDEPETEGDIKQSPLKPKQKLKFTNLVQVSYPEEAGENIYNHQEKALSIDTQDDDDEVMGEFDEPQPLKKAHYKGKGRAWKKTSDDEDEDYKSPAKGKSSQPKRKLGRRKSSQTPASVTGVEDIKKPNQHDDQEMAFVEATEPNSMQKTDKKQRKPRKIHHLSEEYVKDEEDSEIAPESTRTTKGQDERASENIIASVTPTKKTPKKKGRRSDQDSTPKHSSLTDSVTLLLHDDTAPAQKRETQTISTEIVPLSDLDGNGKNSKFEAAVEDDPVDVTRPEEGEHPKLVTESDVAN